MFDKDMDKNSSDRAYGDQAAITNAQLDALTKIHIGVWAGVTGALVIYGYMTRNKQMRRNIEEILKELPKDKRGDIKEISKNAVAHLIAIMLDAYKKVIEYAYKMTQINSRKEVNRNDILFVVKNHHFKTFLKPEDIASLENADMHGVRLNLIDQRIKSQTKVRIASDFDTTIILNKFMYFTISRVLAIARDMALKSKKEYISDAFLIGGVNEWWSTPNVSDLSTSDST